MQELGPAAPFSAHADAVRLYVIKHRLRTGRFEFIPGDKLALQRSLPESGCHFFNIRHTVSLINAPEGVDALLSRIDGKRIMLPEHSHDIDVADLIPDLNGEKLIVLNALPKLQRLESESFFI